MANLLKSNCSLYVKPFNKNINHTRHFSTVLTTPEYFTVLTVRMLKLVDCRKYIAL